MKNRMFQTIGKTKLGGVIEGFIEEYHEEFVASPINRLPIMPNE
jgi:hypothetical protein